MCVILADGEAVMDNLEELRAKLLQLTEEHRDLDNAIDALVERTPFDQLQVQRLKKRKLQLKDMISKLEDLLYPDIIA